MTELWTVVLKADARDDIGRDLHYGSGVEVGALLFGYLEGIRRVVVEAVLETSDEGATSRHVAIDWERAKMLDREGRRVIGDLHSHEIYVDAPRAQESDTDARVWQQLAETLHHPVAGLIIHPRAQRWEAGYPANDWVNPKIDAWIAVPGDQVRPANLYVEPHWLCELEAGLRFRESVAHYHGL